MGCQKPKVGQFYIFFRGFVEVERVWRTQIGFLERGKWRVRGSGGPDEPSNMQSETILMSVPCDIHNGIMESGKRRMSFIPVWDTFIHLFK